MSSDLHVDGVTKHFGDVRAVDDVSFTVEEGTFVTLLGPSGCGKTTTLRMIAGYETPTTGRVTLGDRDITDEKPYQRPTSMVFQSYALFPHKTVGENVGFGLKMRDVPSEERDRRVAEILELVELPGTEDRAIDELSGGQQQRIALARSLVIEPEVLLLDEPLGALDLKLRKNMQVELKDLQEELGITFVYVTHDQEEALTMSDEIVILNDGRIEQRGTPAEIYESPRTRFVAEFIGDTNLLDGTYVATDSGAYLECGSVEFPVEPNPAAESGATLSVSIRPEKVSLEESAARNGGSTETDITLDGVVDDVIYQGNVAKIHVRIGDSELISERHVVNSTDLPTPGSECRVRWTKEHADVLVE
ncbi:ABC transporter ATP-binding protein [Halorubrum vacuolatum]|uniref:Molybdate/tungstate import ATP-binding protein WtpC n=1 Tax=Halorubrum vacuolatum TaxID=63740 RepID=A0A238VKM4_HALVU|nr:ABC transporter ATP-binding protein [Halorubrum vacuolatum]SNR34741.1 putative spermidine/putrescine transport system ATP-binding protein/spermidine/putrescine transport system ATP-binding protein [Halorubrum vacuolatum]